jgi:hypothetical protein
MSFFPCKWNFLLYILCQSWWCKFKMVPLIGGFFFIKCFPFFLIKYWLKIQQNGYTLWTTEWTLWIDGSTLMWGHVFFFALGINWVSHHVYAYMPVGSYFFQNPNPFLLGIFSKSTPGPTSQQIILKL